MFFGQTAVDATSLHLDATFTIPAALRPVTTYYGALAVYNNQGEAFLFVNENGKVGAQWWGGATVTYLAGQIVWIAGA